MAKKRTRKSEAQVTHSEPETFTYAVKPELTPREKKAILEREVHCRKCKGEGERVLGAVVTDDGVLLCRIHGG